ncbi:MAG: hypothetical protein AB1762_13975, partial [Gemmatimonadota bacterium]
RAELEEHVRECGECSERRATLDGDERAVLSLLASLDKPVTPLRAEDIMLRAVREGRTAFLRRAAAIILVTTTAGVAFAMPGSSLRVWLTRAISQLAGEDAPAPAPQPAAAMSGVAVVPGDHFVIRFMGASVSGEAFVSLSDDSTITVRAPLGSATFTSESDRLLIEPHVPTLVVDIAVPRRAPFVEVQVGEQRVFLKRGGTVTLREAAPSGERYRIPLAR